MVAARTGVGDRHRRRLLQLTIESDAELQCLRDLHAGRQLHEARRLSGRHRDGKRVGYPGFECNAGQTARSECSRSAMTTGPLRSLKTPMPARTTFAFWLPGAYATEIRGAKLLLSWK